MSLQDKTIRRDYFQLLWPLLIEQIFMMLIGNVNVFLFSLYNDQAVAATGLADQVLVIGTMAMGIVSLGSTILFLQNADESRLDKLQAIARQSLLLNFLLSLFLVLISWLAGNGIMRLMQTPIELHDMAVSYLRIVSISLFFQALSTTASALLRAFGQVRVAMMVSVTNTLLTIAGNAIVVLSPLPLFGEGIQGIAVATVVTRILGAILSLLSVRMMLPSVWAGLWTFHRADWHYGKDILELGIPSGMENVSYNVSQTIITAAIASLGTVAVNAKIYSQTLTALVFTLSVAAGQVGQIILGRLIRQRKYNQAKRFAIDNTVLFMGLGLVINVMLAAMGQKLLLIFTDDPAIIELAQVLLWMNCLYDPLRVGNEIIIASLNVTGEVRYPVVMAIIVTYLFTVPAALLVTHRLGWGLPAIWLIFIIDEGLRLFFFIRRWWQGDWIDQQKVFQGVDE